MDGICAATAKVAVVVTTAPDPGPAGGRCPRASVPEEAPGAGTLPTPRRGGPGARTSYVASRV